MVTGAAVATSAAAHRATIAMAERATPARTAPRVSAGRWWDVVGHGHLRLSRHGQVLALGGSIRMYVIGPVMFAPHEVIWYRAWLCEMM